MSPKAPQRANQNLATIYEDIDEAVYGHSKVCAIRRTYGHNATYKAQQNLNIADFEILDNLASNTLCRRRGGGGQVLAMRRFEKVGRASPQRISVMKAVNNLCAPFLAKMHCHFVHSDTLHVIMVGSHLLMFKLGL